ncbi:MAG: T9SS type A sorting domain-containing protein, partial [Candidatus Cloacimonetes bacterium]|nr:T9SS type A sorting domain-containing protein [Candidatus Cloacimonadota bacterium]
NIIESNTTHNNNIVDPPIGVFWRNYLFNHADPGYPVLRDTLAGCQIVWNGVQNVNPSQTHAAAVVTHWINECMEFTSDYERPHQPVRILRKHIGRCGEHADLTAAAARAALIPCTSILAISHDHTWNEFWEERWVSWEPVNNMLDTPLTYENGWGWQFASVFEIRSDGWLTPVTGTYSDETSTITIYALDNDGNPIDGAEILLAVQVGTSIYVDNYDLTDNEGKFCFIVGEGRHYYARIDTDIGSYPSAPDQVVSLVDNTVAGEDYTFYLSVSGTMPSLDWISIDPPEDTINDYHLEIDFTMPSQIVSGRILMDDVDDFSQLCKREDNGIIDYFMTDELNFIWYLVDMPFECFNLLPASEQGFITFDIPADYDWYCIFANNRRLNNLQNVCGSAKLYFYEEIGVDGQEIEQTSFSLLQNYPNPFSASTMFSFFTTKNTPVLRSPDLIGTKGEKDTLLNSKHLTGQAKITIYNIKGQLVKVLDCGSANWTDTKANEVFYSILWDSKDESGKPLSSGIYFYNLKVGDKTIDIKKCLILK